MNTIAKILFAIALSVWTPGMEVTPISETIPERGPAPRLLVQHEPFSFSFALPPQWRYAADPASLAVSLRPPAGEAIATVQIRTNRAAPSLTEMKAKAAERFRSIKVIETYSAPSGGKPGLGIEFEHVLGGLPYLSKLHVYLLDAGQIEVMLTAKVGSYDPIHHAWTEIIRSLQMQGQVAVSPSS